MIYLVVGAGPAGVVAAEHLRKLDPLANITIVGSEPEPPYSRMAIPYFLTDKIDERGTYLRKTAEHYQSLDINVVNKRVDSIDTDLNRVITEDGEAFRYDKLLLATGASPSVPPVPGIDLPGVHNCWTLKDAREIVRLAAPGASVVLMGAGFIGCIILESLALRDVSLTVVEMENRMVPRMMNDISGNMIKRWCEEKGVAVNTSTRAESIEQINDGKLRVNLSNGSAVDADLVISATGVKSNMQFAVDSGLKADQGILVNEYLQTSNEDIYAAGDVCQGKDFSTGEYSVQAIQPTAVEHAKFAAGNMVRGHRSEHAGNVNMNVLDTIGLVSASFGSWMGVEGGESAELVNEKEYKYLNLQFKDDVLVGASSLGLTQHVGVLRGLIQSQTRLGVWKDRLMKDPMKIMEAYLSSAQSQVTPA
ncbi:pyridine nucleotide-disulfide oxidoreductase [Chromatiales bacterium (ex Bugula neritina AB1)]|nr:pyridine nucleotide-disulfide oxidoreductase [Chromatiales bacterium (ex Bugula neritina AB1)]